MNQPRPPLEQYKSRGTYATAFLRALFPSRATGFIEFRSKCQRNFVSQRWYSPDGLPYLASILRSNDDCDLWFGVALRRREGSGGAPNCQEAWSLHVDFDGRTPGRADTFKSKLAAFPIKPTLGVATGSPHSFHCYWRLSEPVRFLTATGLPDLDTISLYSRTISGLARYFDGDRSVGDTPRVMRLPGSRNMKPTANGALVELRLYEPDRMYKLEDFAGWADAKEEDPAPRLSSITGHSDDVNLIDEFTKRSWMIEDQGDEFYYVRCPWIHEHTSSSGPSETALWCYEGRWCFRCMHSHCSKRRIAECYDFFRLMQMAEML